MIYALCLLLAPWDSTPSAWDEPCLNKCCKGSCECSAKQCARSDCPCVAAELTILAPDGAVIWLDEKIVGRGPRVVLKSEPFEKSAVHRYAVSTVQTMRTVDISGGQKATVDLTQPKVQHSNGPFYMDRQAVPRFSGGGGC